MDTREVVTRYFEYVNSGNWDAYLDLFDENVVMDEQLLGRVEGIQAVREGIEGLRTTPKFQNRPREIVVEGDRAMVVWHISLVAGNGAEVEADGVNFFVIKDGKIVRFANFHDTVPFQPIFE